eukprot:6141367-Prymnesium_polylepis.1
MVVRAFGIYLGTRQAQHSKATGNSVQSTYDADNGSNDFGAGEMGRAAEEVEPGDSLAERRVPAINDIQKPSDVPRDSRAWREMVLEDDDYKAAMASPQQKVPSALMQKLGKRAVTIHRQHVHEAGQELLCDADEATLLKQTQYVDYPQMTEGEAVAFLLDRCNAVDERPRKVARVSTPEEGTTDLNGAAVAECVQPAAQEVTRAERRVEWCARRAAMLEGEHGTITEAAGETAEVPTVGTASEETGVPVMGTMARGVEDVPVEESVRTGGAEDVHVEAAACPEGAASEPPAPVMEVTTEVTAAQPLGSTLSQKRAREDAMYADYKRRKGTGGNAIVETMAAYGFRSTQRSTFMGMMQRAAARS